MTAHGVFAGTASTHAGWRRDRDGIPCRRDRKDRAAERAQAPRQRSDLGEPGGGADATGRVLLRVRVSAVLPAGLVDPGRVRARSGNARRALARSLIALQPACGGGAAKSGFGSPASGNSASVCRRNTYVPAARSAAK